MPTRPYNPNHEQTESEAHERLCRIEDEIADKGEKEMNRLEQAKLVLKYATDEIERLEAELAEAEKPKLRHGGVYVDRSFVVVVRFCKGEWEATHADGSKMVGTHKRIREHLDDFTFSHNIFDDLKAMSEDLTEFKMGDWDFSYDTAGLHMELRDKSCHVTDKHVPAFILNIRCLYATQQRRTK